MWSPLEEPPPGRSDPSGLKHLSALCLNGANLHADAEGPAADTRRDDDPVLVKASSGIARVIAGRIVSEPPEKEISIACNPWRAPAVSHSVNLRDSAATMKAILSQSRSASSM
jgi:hypothetical protein